MAVSTVVVVVSCVAGLGHRSHHCDLYRYPAPLLFQGTGWSGFAVELRAGHGGHDNERGEEGAAAWMGRQQRWEIFIVGWNCWLKDMKCIRAG
jgi:hypothetical protein